MTCIIDMAGISLRHCSSATLSVLHKRTRLEEDHYPEVVKRVFLINTPSVFASVWSIVKRWVRVISTHVRALSRALVLPAPMPVHVWCLPLPTSAILFMCDTPAIVGLHRYLLIRIH